MEFSKEVVRAQRVLLGVFLAALAATARLESRSAAAAAVRAGQPWLGILAAQVPGQAAEREFLLVYQPERRLLDLVYLTPSVKDGLGAALAAMPLAKSDAQPPVLSESAAGWPDLEPPLAAREWLLRRLHGRGFWREAVQGVDRLILALEWQRLSPESVRASWLPEEEDDRRTLFGRLLAKPSSAEGPAPNVEILNATGRPGVASLAKDVLRLQGVDVINVGNAPGARPDTVVYDRTGRVENAQAVREKLGCLQARAATQIKTEKLVDVTVVLGADCPQPGRTNRGYPWNLSRF